MEILKRLPGFALAAAFALSASAAPEFKIVLESGGILGEPLRVEVRTSALTVSDKEFVHANWVDYLEWSAVDATGNTVPLTIDSVKSEATTQASGNQRRHGVRQDVWTAKASVVFAALPVGQTTITAKFRTKSASASLMVLRGDETPAAIDAGLRRETEKLDISYERYRELQLQRLELHPTDESILWALAERSERWAPIEETEGYYIRAIEAERARLAGLKASDNEGYRRYAEAELPAFESRERMVRAVRCLLPEYYKNRERLGIRKLFETNSVELIDAVSLRVIKAIDTSKEHEDCETAMVITPTWQ